MEAKSVGGVQRKFKVIMGWPQDVRLVVAKCEFWGLTFLQNMVKKIFYKFHMHAVR